MVSAWKAWVGFGFGFRLGLEFGFGFGFRVRVRVGRGVRVEGLRARAGEAREEATLDEARRRRASGSREQAAQAALHQARRATGGARARWQRLVAAAEGLPGR